MSTLSNRHLDVLYKSPTGRSRRSRRSRRRGRRAISRETARWWPDGAVIRFVVCEGDTKVSNRMMEEMRTLQTEIFCNLGLPFQYV